TIYPLRNTRRVYCAGPLFNGPERQEISQIAEHLRDSGFETFVPHADGLEFARVQPYLADEGYDPAAAGRLLHEAIFALDVYQVACGCGSLVLNMNGRVPDEGAVSEAAMAWTLGKPMVIFKADARSKVAGRDNPLVVGLSGFRTVDEIDAIGPALAARLVELQPDPEWATPCPAHLGETLAAGGRLWRRLTAMGAERPDELVAAAVMDEFGAPARLQISARWNSQE
ncbi:MAG TPA: nucleoside 2-deoxyribosyltransferase, partial [Pirellulales bacterium]|nr:nucleoside 2-deoxyribosyltransferase [Pirellulales bacterium]